MGVVEREQRQGLGWEAFLLRDLKTFGKIVWRYSTYYVHDVLTGWMIISWTLNILRSTAILLCRLLSHHVSFILTIVTTNSGGRRSWDQKNFNSKIGEWAVNPPYLFVLVDGGGAERSQSLELNPSVPEWMLGNVCLDHHTTHYSLFRLLWSYLMIMTKQTKLQDVNTDLDGDYHGNGRSLKAAPLDRQ